MEKKKKTPTPIPQLMPSTGCWPLFSLTLSEMNETVYKVLTCTGRNWNNSYGPITIGPNGTAYVGVFNGLVSITDKK